MKIIPIQLIIVLFIVVIAVKVSFDLKKCQELYQKIEHNLDTLDRIARKCRFIPSAQFSIKRQSMRKERKIIK